MRYMLMQEENENLECKYGDKLVDLSCENEADTTIINPAAADQPLTDEGTDATEIQSEGTAHSY